MRNRLAGYLGLALTLGLMLVGTMTVLAQNQGDPESVMDSMSESIDNSPLVEPTVRPGAAVNDDVSFQPDPRVLGVAPGGPTPTLRREGEFIINRRGRLIRATGAGLTYMFAFDADEKSSPEAPMFIMPCQHLQSMESMVRERGDKVVFQLSGQIFTYRGANYVLPTMWKLSIDRGNLQR